MTTITEVNQYDSFISQLETSDPVMGGANGASNAQAKGLANRTRWLKTTLDTLVNWADQLGNIITHNVNEFDVAGAAAAAQSAAASDATTKANTAQSNAQGYALNTVGGGLLTKIIEIGDWNMDADSSRSVSHNVSNYKNIREVKAIIRDDSDDIYFPLDSFDWSLVEISGGISIIHTNDITLQRRTGGIFDSASFDSTSFNRGWIIIKHLP